MESIKKKNILIFIDWFKPGYKAGGPIKSVFNISKLLEKQANVFICTSNTDLNSPEPYPNIKFDEWTEFSDNTKVIYLSAEGHSSKQIKSVLTHKKFNVIYLNSVFSIKFSLFPLYLSKKLSYRPKLVLAPRGMLGSGALQLKKTKKKTFLTLSKLFKLYDGIIWHASSKQEATEVINVFGSTAKTVVVPNLSSISKITPDALKKKEMELSLFFFSRISKKKNLLGALKLLQSKYDGQIKMSIFGPIEDESYWSECQQVISKLPENIQVTYSGILKPEEISFAISQCHFLLLPTFHENYGHVIIESLSNGKPVIISDQTPWQKLESKNIGWAIEINNQSSFEKTLKTCLNMRNSTYQNMSSSSIEFAKHVIHDKGVIEKNIDLFLK